MKKLLLILVASAACMAFAHRADAQLNYVVDCMGQYFLAENISGDMGGERIDLYYNGSINAPVGMLESMLYNWNQQPYMRYLITVAGSGGASYVPNAMAANTVIYLDILSATDTYTQPANITFINQCHDLPDVVIRNYP